MFSKKERTLNPTMKIERLPNVMASDLQDVIQWIKENPLKASMLGVVGVIALRNKGFRSLLGTAAVSFLSTKLIGSVEHTLH